MRLQLQITDSSKAAYEKLLLNIEWSVWWYIIQPPTHAVQFMFSLLKTVPMNGGVDGSVSSHMTRLYSAVFRKSLLWHPL